MMLIDVGLWVVERALLWAWRRPGEGPEADRRARLEAEILRSNERLARLGPDGSPKRSKEGVR